MNRLLLVLLLFPLSSLAQGNSRKPLRDSFEYQVLSTLDKVLDKVLDPAGSPMALAGQALEPKFGGEVDYLSTVQLPGAEPALVKFEWSDRKKGESHWEWKAVIRRMPRTAPDSALQLLKAKMDTLIACQQGAWKKRCGERRCFSILPLISEPLGEPTLTLFVSFIRPITTSEEAAADSIIARYTPLLLDRSTVDKYSPVMDKAFQLEDIPRALAHRKSAELLQQLAAANMECAFGFLMKTRYMNAVRLKETLSGEQQVQITRMAQNYLDTYRAETDRRTGTVRVDKQAVQARPTPAAAAAPKAATPCEAATMAAPFRMGDYLAGNGTTAYVQAYDCKTHNYTLFEYDNAKNKLIRKTMDEAAAKSTYSRTREVHFILCSNCAGRGSSQEYEWYHTDSYSGFYARSNKQVTVGCGVCRGSGYIKVQ